MEFIFDTEYDQEAVTAMARGLRKTIRKKHSRRSHVLGWIIILLAILQTLPLNDRPFLVEGRVILLWAAALLVLVALLFEDRLNAFFARRRMMPGTDRATSVFTEESYRSETAAGTTQWRYDTIGEIAEDKHYFIFVFDQRYAQVYDKRTLSGGNVEEFRAFISDKTGKAVAEISCSKGTGKRGINGRSLQ